MKIVRTDNFGGDYPVEEVVNLPKLSNDQAQRIADAINKELSGDYSTNFWKVVEDSYEPCKGFES